MSPESERPPTDDEQIADLFDELLQEVLEGREPDLDLVRPDRPDLREKVVEAYQLACSVAGRREPGRPTLGGYDIVRELGRGGMGTVYLARQVALDREVAVKVLPNSLGLSPRAKRRFLDEARAMARLNHDSIVRIHRIIDHTEMLAFEMEYIEGPSLRDALEQLRKEGPNASLSDLAGILGVDVEELHARNLVDYMVKVGISMARALDEVHQNGLVHRDVKPSNILLRKNGKALLADFGLVRDIDLNVTRTDAFAGTPIYASPEQLRVGDEAVDARSDVYSLGVALYEAIARTPPFAGRSTADVLRRIEGGRVPPLRKNAPHVSRDLETIIAKAMELNPKDRYVSAGELADDLERLLTLQPIRARPAGPLRRAGKFGRRHRKTLLAGVAGALVVGLGLWPVIDHALAAGSDRAKALQHARTAHLHLISNENRQIAWGQAGSGPRIGERSTAISNQVKLLRSALAEYGAALELLPDDRRLQLEHGVVRLVLWLRTESPSSRDQIEVAVDSPAFADVIRPLPELTTKVARRLAELHRGRLDAQDLLVEIRAAEADERLAIGLLGFLLGDYRLCEGSWSGFELETLDYPLLDAGLGMLYAADARPERAYPRLFHAHRAFTESRVLALELADAALAMGDVQLARRWLERVEATGLPADSDLRLKLLRADLLAAEGRTEDARTCYLELTRAHRDPAPRHRMAHLALNRGDLRQARAILEQLLSEWPDGAEFRLDLARIALQQEDLGTYLAQARYVMAQEFGATRSRGTAHALLEILRIGGLRRLYDEGVARTGSGFVDHRWRGFEKPIRSWAPSVAIERIEEVLGRLARFDRSRAEAASVLPQAAGDVSRRVLDLSNLVACFPETSLLMGSINWMACVHGVPLVSPKLSSWADRQLFPLLFRLDYRLLSSYPLHPILEGETDPNLLLGHAIGTTGDLDGDGVPEFLVGSPPVDVTVSRGRVYLVSGRTGARLHEVSHDRQDVIFGFTVAGVGDVDGDGVPDWIVGAPVGEKRDGLSGVALVYSGRDGIVLRELRGDSPSFGVAVAGVGDLDNDGRAEVVVGTSPLLLNSAAQGTVRIFAGADGAIIRELPSDQAGVWFGGAVAAAGDVDRDGYTDVIVGGNYGGAPGLVRVYSGRDGGILHTWGDQSTTALFGYAVGSAGDLNGDGHGDVFVGAPGNSQDGSRGGRLFLFSGGDGAELGILHGDGPGDAFGFCAVALGDLNRDGVREIGVGAPTGGPARCGYVRVFSGRGRSPVRSYFGPHPDYHFGASAIAAPDVDGDGIDDFAVGNALPRRSGRVATVSGATVFGF